MALALMLWAVLIYVAVMVRIDADIRHPPQQRQAANPSPQADPR